MVRQRFIAVLLVSVAASASAKELWERPWIEVRSPHFVIVSAVSEKDTVDLARDLERFRTAVQMLTSIGRFEERITTKVYVLPQKVAKLGFKRGIGGYLLPQMRANFAAVAPVGSAALDDVLKHEYVHFLVHNRDTLNYPMWFDEGYAEVFMTLTASGDVIEYGQPSRGRVSWLAQQPWMPFETLLNTRDINSLRDDLVAMFYAQSWLLMHYLILGRPDRNFAADATEFLRLVETGMKDSDAFEQAFGLPVAKLHVTLFAYINGKLRVTRLSNQKLPDTPTEVLPIAADAVAAQLAMLAWFTGEPDEATRYFEAALALNPNNTQALVGVGDSLKHAGHFDEAQPYYEKALALEPQNAHVELDFAEYFHGRALAAKDTEEATTYLVEARRHFTRSYKLDANNPETLAMNGWSYLRPGDSLDKARESLTAAHAMLPSQPRIKLLLAQAYVMSGDSAKAEPILRSLVAWGHAGLANDANKLLDQLANAKAPSGEALSAEPTVSQ